MQTRRELLSAAALVAVGPSLSLAQQPPTARLRGTIEAVSPTSLTLRQRNGEKVDLSLPPGLAVTEVYPVTLADIQANSFVGVGAMPQADGTQRAIAVTLFPEAMRGTGEGHRPFDFLPQSTMTNATVADVAASPDGRRLRLRYPAGEQTIVVPPDTPIVSLRPADRALLVPGAAVALTAQDVQGRPTATRISAGRGGFAPPY